LILVAFLVVLTNGCAYFKHRGNDALDFIDLGVTVNQTWWPAFGVYFDPFSLMPLGYSNVDAKFIGMSHRQVGAIDYTNHAWGAIVWGRERRGIGPFNPNNPYHARPDQRDLTQRPVFDVGPVGLAAADNPPPWLHYFEFNRGIHVGWVGVDTTCRISEMLDFILGWTTLDIIGDDY
jgi:hypothetical protein